MIRLFAFSVAALLASNALARAPCKLTPIGTATAAAVRDGRTIALDDGRVLRLAGIEVTGTSRAALRRLAAGRTLRLEKLGTGHDRYGRVLAFAFAGRGRQSLEQELLAAGQALVGPQVGDKACAEALLEAEGAARAGRRGLWADRRFLPINAGNIARLRAEKGHFALVEGEVLSVHPSGGTIYLNFGRRRTHDFSVIILRRRRGLFAAADTDPLRLVHRNIRVRGFIEIRRGPIIEAEVPEQIEIVDFRSGDGTYK